MLGIGPPVFLLLPSEFFSSSNSILDDQLISMMYSASSIKKFGGLLL